MRRIYKIAGSMLVAGVLIAGIGSGVAFAEYSSFEYGGEAVLTGSERFTRTLEYKVSTDGDVTEKVEQPQETTEVSNEATEQEIASPNIEETQEDGQSKEPDTGTEEKRMLNIRLDYYPYTVVEDSSVPKDIVYFEISYLTDNQNIKPEIIVENSAATEEFIYLDYDFQYNDFRDMMRVKDPILSDLKNHKISNYQLDKIELIKVWVNPDADFDMYINGY